MSHPIPHAQDGALPAERIALVDLLDRVLAGGVVISGEVRLSIADVDLVRVSLQALIASVSGGFGEICD
jgi:Gas vesicle protein